MPAIQIRKVPNDLHARLKARAAYRGQSLSQYALAELRRAAERETIEEVFARITAAAPDRSVDDPGHDVVAIIHEGRAER